MAVNNTVLQGDKAREAIKKGCQLVADVVGATHGPGGHNVIIDKAALLPHSTKDGVSVARELFFIEDKWQRQAAQILINASLKQLTDAGDGTTTTIVIANEILQEGMKAIEDGINPTQFRVELQEASQAINDELKKLARPVTNIEQVATIAANNNSKLGRMIAEAITKVGQYGIVNYETAYDGVDRIEYTEGYQFNAGIKLPWFYTDHKKRNMEYHNPLILVSDQLITWGREIMPFMEQVDKKNQKDGTIHPVIFIADVRQEALAILAESAAKKKYPCAVISMEGIGKEKTLNYQDVATYLGAKFISEARGLKVQHAKTEDCGTCKLIKSDLKTTQIIEGRGDTTALKDQLKDLVKSEDSIEREYAKTRLARLEGGVATIKIYGKTESEQNEVLDRVDDAIRATRSAQEEGIVPGCGYAYLYAKHNDMTSRNSVGRQVILSAISRVSQNIFDNAYLTEPASKYIGIGKHKGYDVLNRQPIDDMFRAGIVDPLKVVRTALENAVSVASLLLISKCLILTERDEAEFIREIKS